MPMATRSKQVLVRAGAVFVRIPDTWHMIPVSYRAASYSRHGRRVVPSTARSITATERRGTQTASFSTVDRERTPQNTNLLPCAADGGYIIHTLYSVLDTKQTLEVWLCHTVRISRVHQYVHIYSIAVLYTVV